MPRTPLLEHSSSLRALGAAFLALCLLLVWLSWAFFSKSFVDRVPVFVEATAAGLQLPQNADVKLRGMIVGEVTDIASTGNGARITLGIKPELIDQIPAGVTAQMVPKTLFGQKFVALIAPDEPTGGHLAEGDTITKADVPIEVEQMLNDIYPLLQSVEPAKLSYALTAMATALQGRGEQLGDTFVKLNDYLTALGPDVPALLDDIADLGEVSSIYADAAPDLTRLLGNAAITSRTVVSQRQQLVAFFDNTEQLAGTLNAFVERSGEDLVALQASGRVVLRTVSKYSSTFPCFLAAMDTVIPRIESAFRGGTLHINAQMIAGLQSPTGYASAEPVAGSQAEIDASPVARANCLDLAELAQLPDGDQGPYPHAHPYVYADDTIYSLFGLDTRHNKFCVPAGSDWGQGWGPCLDTPLPRAAAESLYSAAGIEGDTTAEERAALNGVIAAWLGMSADEVPDVASLLVGPVLRGAEVSF